MTGTLAGLSLAAAFLLASHVGLSSSRLRGFLVLRLGRPIFLALYSVVAVGALIWLVTAYARAPYLELWPAPQWTTYLPLVLMPLANVLLIAGLFAADATVTSDGTLPAGADPAPGILKVTRHPVMWAIVLWAASHIPANGDAAALIFFGSLLALALAGTVLIDAKRAREGGEAWQRFAAVTSRVPFAATLSGRNRVTLSDIGWAKVLGGLTLYAAFVYTHEWLIGPSPFPG
jgi:uncharacterized membrane protein